jgi:hypothetical protein
MQYLEASRMPTDCHCAECIYRLLRILVAGRPYDISHELVAVFRPQM